MKKSRLPLILVASGAVAAGLWWSARLALGQPAPPAALKGDFVFVLDGTSASNGQLHFVRWAGRETFDGDGGVSGILATNNDGVIQRGNFRGTYTIDRREPGVAQIEMTDNRGNVSRFDAFFGKVDDVLAYLRTDGGITASGYAHRVSQSTP